MTLFLSHSIVVETIVDYRQGHLGLLALLPSLTMDHSRPNVTNSGEGLVLDGPVHSLLGCRHSLLFVLGPTMISTLFLFLLFLAPG